jgi:hypothetical protein
MNKETLAQLGFLGDVPPALGGGVAVDGEGYGLAVHPRREGYQYARHSTGCIRIAPPQTSWRKV